MTFSLPSFDSNEAIRASFIFGSSESPFDSSQVLLLAAQVVELRNRLFQAEGTLNEVIKQNNLLSRKLDLVLQANQKSLEMLDEQQKKLDEQNDTITHLCKRHESQVKRVWEVKQEVADLQQEKKSKSSW